MHKTEQFWFCKRFWWSFTVWKWNWKKKMLDFQLNCTSLFITNGIDFHGLVLKIYSWRYTCLHTYIHNSLNLTSFNCILFSLEHTQQYWKVFSFYFLSLQQNVIHKSIFFIIYNLYIKLIIAIFANIKSVKLNHFFKKNWLLRFGYLV